VPNKAELEANFRAWLKANRDSESCDVITWTEHLLQQRPQLAAQWPQISNDLIQSLISDILRISTVAFNPIPAIRARLVEVLRLYVVNLGEAGLIEPRAD
jgi:hypothetical protein